ncbi:MAG: hypothetical protein Q8P41_08270 [Pseudomonadota bacterium]|nr:hypothetical protein [Pseudomonadota bacterium]
MLFLSLALALLGCATPDEVDYESDESYECVCAADYEDDTAYYSEDVVQTVCMDPAYADLVVEDAVEDCASDLEDLGYYNITCSCLCDALGEEC